MEYQSPEFDQTGLQHALKNSYVGKTIEDVKTPAFVIDRSIFESNCAGMIKKAKEWGADFRAHLKTHKSTEGTKLQLATSEGKTGAVVVSTVKEAWEVWNSELVKDGYVNDILYGLPIGLNKISDLSALWDQMELYGGVVRLLVDHPEQIKLLEAFGREEGKSRPWSVFVKINGGQNRAGVATSSEALKSLVSAILGSSVVRLYGFYAHAGNAYASKSQSEATKYLSSEVQTVNDAAQYTLTHFKEQLASIQHTEPFVLSVGSTPTAHVSGLEAREILKQTLHGKLELHAGNYPLLDLQQQHTSLIDYPRIAQHVRALVVSYYPARGNNGEDEALIDAGAIAFSKDTGPSGSFGEVIGKPWTLARISQEHGILRCTNMDSPDAKLEVGTIVEIVGQHACLIAARSQAYPWYYVVDSRVGGGKEIVDVWVAWKGW
ncbi:hypothetical protein FA15DRAFT_683766 [Coprinopsis marcescibilis]|uniref:D-serine dehydratase n=1 Tax=Coprinopsis marcescibilis TaxID=230819 RepID=A0A5C3LNW2_COPMA|nr:hypothetical protein FA15DRAFT_683766 [Coprinopsis marcescibilis]